MNDLQKTGLILLGIGLVTYIFMHQMGGGMVRAVNPADPSALFYLALIGLVTIFSCLMIPIGVLLWVLGAIRK